MTHFPHRRKAPPAGIFRRAGAFSQQAGRAAGASPCPTGRRYVWRHVMRAHTQVRPYGKPRWPFRYFRGMAPTAARRAHPVQRGGYQGLPGNPDACRPRRGSAWRDDHYGAPAEAQRSGFGGERRHSGGNELCRLRRSEQSVTCADDAAMSPRSGGRRGALPRPLLFPHFFGKKWGRPPRRRAPRGAR